MGNTAVIFDLDGTLWDSVENVVTAWNYVIETSGVPERMTGEQMSGYMGKTIEQIAELFFHSVPKEQGLEIIRKCCDYESGYLSVHGGRLYPQLKETLERLSAEYFLAIVSNCQPGYIEAFLTAHSMRAYFSDWVCYGETGKPKGENIRLVMQRNSIGKAVYIGDTEADFEACRQAGVPFIHASYGFGSVGAEVPRIGSLAELPAMAGSLLEGTKG